MPSEAIVGSGTKYPPGQLRIMTAERTGNEWFRRFSHPKLLVFDVKEAPGRTVANRKLAFILVADCRLWWDTQDQWSEQRTDGVLVSPRNGQTRNRLNLWRKSKPSSMQSLPPSRRIFVVGSVGYRPSRRGAIPPESDNVSRVLRKHQQRARQTKLWCKAMAEPALLGLNMRLPCKWPSGRRIGSTVLWMALLSRG